MVENAIDLLFEEQIKAKEVFPQEVVDAIAEIIRRNDKFIAGSSRRVSMKRTIKFVREKLNYNITRQQIEKIVQGLGRKSWAHE